MNSPDIKSTTATHKLELAQQLFKEYYATCFWHWDPEHEVTEATLPLVAKGLRHHGGRRGWLAAAQLEEM